MLKLLTYGRLTFFTLSSIPTIILWIGCVTTLQSQNLYYEDFKLPNGTVEDNGSSAWSITYIGSGDFHVTTGTFFGYQYDFFHGNNLNGEAVWQSDVINISTFPTGVDISVDVGEFGDFQASDYIRLYYRLDGGPEVLFGSHTGNFGFYIFLVENSTRTNLTGSSLQIVVRMKNDRNEGYHFFDNVRVSSYEDQFSLYSIADGEWDRGTTWSLTGYDGTACSCFPDETTDVYVGNSKTILLNNSGYVKNMRIGSTGAVHYTASNTNLWIGAGSSMTVESGGMLDENNATNCYLVFQGSSGVSQLINEGGTLQLDAIYQRGSNTLIVSGSGNLSAGSIVFSAAGSIINNYSDILNLNGGIYFYSSNASFSNNGSLVAASGIFSNSSNNNNLLINNTDATLTVGSISLNNGNLTINNSGIFQQNSNFVNGSIDTGSQFNNLEGGIWYYAGTNHDQDVNNILNCSGSTNTFQYNGNTDQNIISATYHHLTLSGSGTKFTQNDLYVEGNLTLSGSSSLNVSSSADNIFLKGNWIGTGGTFMEGTQTVTLNGSNDQIISQLSGESFYHLTINKTAGSVILAAGHVSIRGNLTMTAGNILMGEYNLTITGTGKVLNGKASSFLISSGSGKLIQHNLGAGGRTGSIHFPVGAQAGSYTPLFINNEGTADHFSVRVCGGIYQQGSCNGSSTSSEAVNRTWLVEEANMGGSDVTLTFQWNAEDELEEFNRSDLSVIHHNGSSWEEIDYGTASGSGPYTLSARNVSSFSPFGIKNTDAIVLPIELLSFHAQLAHEHVVISWSTASEENNRHFTLEKTVDLVHYQEVAVIQGQGSSSRAHDYQYKDTAPLTGVSYYRLKQTDFDGRYTYSPFAIIRNEAYFSNISLYPIPSNGEFVQLNISGIKEVENLHIQVFDITGKPLYNNTLKFKNKAVATLFFRQKLIPGIYTVQVSNSITTKSRKFTVQ